MTTLPMGQVIGLARAAGFSASEAVTMGAIAAAESGLRTDAVGDRNLVSGTWGPSIGLWQIRSLNAHKGTGKERDGSRLYDPAFNARSARVIYGQQGYRAWSVYSSGAYGRHLDAAREAADGLTGGDVVGIIGGAIGQTPVPGAGLIGGVLGSNPVDAVGDVVGEAAGGVLGGIDAVGAFFGQLSQRGTWVRVGQVGGGVLLIGGGLLWLGKDLAAPLLSVASDVVPQGRAIKAVGAATKLGDAAKAAS